MKAHESQWSAKQPLLWGCLTVAAIFFGFGAWSMLTTLSGAIIAPGQIEVSQSRQIVQHPDGGVVKEILVEEGAEVLAGAVLLRLDGSALSSELVIVEHQILELGARRARLEAQRDNVGVVSFQRVLVTAAEERDGAAEIFSGQISLFDKQAEALTQAKEQLKTRIGQIESQVDGLVAQQEAIATQTRLLSSELVTQRDLLAKGLTQSTRVSGIEREIAQLKGRMGELTSARAESAGRITEIEIEISALITEQREKAEAELRDVVARQLELIERRSALKERILRLDVRAPASGIVLALQVNTPQSVIRPADALMFIVPQDRPLLVAARVPVTHVDEVRLNQEVRLVFSSLPTRMTPELVGRVTLVSAAALTDERSGMTYFRIEIAIDTDSLRQLGPIHLVPGMPVETFIRTGERTPFSYLLKPFTDYFRSAFRET